MIKRTKAAINYTTCYTLAAFFFSFLGSLCITAATAMCSSGIRSTNFQNTTNDDSRTNVE